MNLKKLSKIMSHALRHEPEHYMLTLDHEGWCSIDDLITNLKPLDKDFQQLAVGDFQMVMDESDKKRFEIDLTAHRIRALYGHSINDKIDQSPAVPPEFLYHGTSLAAYQSIQSAGLLPMNRQYVHLSHDLKTAIIVGKRKDKNPIILKVHSLKAHHDGIPFYTANDDTWLADAIPYTYFEILQQDDSL